MADEAYHPILEMYSKWLRSQLAATFHACIIVIACTCTLRYSWTILEVRILVTSEIHKNSNEVYTGYDYCWSFIQVRMMATVLLQQL